MDPESSDKNVRTLVLRDELQKLWGDLDVFQEVQQLKGEIAREAPGRQTLRFELSGKCYYRKLHTGVGWSEILKNLVRLRLPIIGAANEWNALNRLAEIGVHSFIPVAYGEKYFNPAKRLSFIVTRELAGTQQLDYFLQEQLNSRALLFSQKRALLCELARVARTIHQHGINHRDLYLCHFLVDLSSVGEATTANKKPLLYLADLHRAQIREQVPRRWLVKDIASICFSMLQIKLSIKDILRVLKYYFGVSLIEVERTIPGILLDIKKRTQKLYAREQRLAARKNSGGSL